MDGLIDDQIENAVRACQDRLDIEAEYEVKETVGEKMDRLFGGETSDDTRLKLLYAITANANTAAEKAKNADPYIAALGKVFFMGLELGKQYEAER